MRRPWLRLILSFYSLVFTSEFRGFGLRFLYYPLQSTGACDRGCTLSGARAGPLPVLIVLLLVLKVRFCHGAYARGTGRIGSVDTKAEYGWALLGWVACADKHARDRGLDIGFTGLSHWLLGRTESLYNSPVFPDSPPHLPCPRNVLYLLSMHTFLLIVMDHERTLEPTP